MCSARLQPQPGIRTGLHTRSEARHRPGPPSGDKPWPGGMCSEVAVAEQLTPDPSPYLPGLLEDGDWKTDSPKCHPHLSPVLASRASFPHAGGDTAPGQAGASRVGVGRAGATLDFYDNRAYVVQGESREGCFPPPADAFTWSSPEEWTCRCLEGPVLAGLGRPQHPWGRRDEPLWSEWLRTVPRLWCSGREAAFCIGQTWGHGQCQVHCPPEVCWSWKEALGCPIGAELVALACVCDLGLAYLKGQSGGQEEKLLGAALPSQDSAAALRPGDTPARSSYCRLSMPLWLCLGAGLGQETRWASRTCLGAVDIARGD